MKTKHLLLTLLLALMVPLAAFAQVERTVTVNNGTDKYHRVPAYGGREINQWYRNEFVIDKAYLQEMAGKQIIKMELYVAQPVPSSYMATSGSYAVRIREKDWATSGSYSGDSPAFRINPITTLEDQQRNGSFDFDGKGNIVVRFSSSFLYSGENNLVVQFESEKHNWLVSPFGIDNLPLYYGVNHTGYALEYCNTEQENTYLNGGTVFAKNQVRNFAPKVTFTYLDEATWANTNKPQNPVATALSSSSIRLSWEAGDYTGSNYQVLCVERGTTPSWSNAVTVSNTYYTFENLASNTTYDLYVRARVVMIGAYNSKAASATATTQHGGNLDEGPIAFDFGEGTHPNGLTVTGNDTHLVTYGGCLSYSGENTVTVTLPRLHFTNATNGLMLEFNMNQPQGSPNPVLVELVDEYQNETLFSRSVSCNSYQSFSFRLKDGLAVSSVMLHNCYKIRFTATGPFSLYNINVRKLADNIPAYDLAATDVTTTSAKINWTDDNLNTHTLELYYRTKGYHNGDQEYWQGYVSVTGTSHTLTGLMLYTEYEVMVKTINGSNSENSATLTFGTHCPEQTVPYEQDFTGLTALPQYWRIEGETSTTTYHYYVDDDGITFTSSISGNWVSERNAYIILPYFGNLASLQFSFENRGGGGYVTVGVMTDPFDVSSFRSREYVGNSIGTHNISFGDNWASDIQYGHIALQVNKGYYDGYVQVDNFVVTRLAAPTGLVVSNVTNTTSTLGWNAGAATQWEVRYGTDANNYGTPVAVTEPTYTITGLTASTDYVAQVRAKYGDGLYSDWVSFEGFKTYYSAPILVDASHPYSHGFSTMQSTGNGFTIVGDIGGWQLINKGLFGNDWVLGTAPGRLNGSLSGLNNYSLYISKDESTYQYIHGETPLIGGGWQGWGTTVYAARVFTLAPGSYQFSYRWKGKGSHESDYFRVALVPADTELTASNAVPTGLTYNSLPSGWIALDGGEALNPMADNVIGFPSYTTPEASRINILEEGNYMMVFVWTNSSLKFPSAVNPPVAIDEIVISCVSLITPPEMGNLVAAPTDTQATLTWQAPTCTLTPTGYEVEYATDASFTDALTATTNTNSVTLTGLAANTNYYVRIRSVHTANSTTIYSDWSDARSFTTNYPTPTNLTLVRQTTSMAQVMWTPVELTLPEGQRINYSWQLTTDVNDWGEANEGLASNGWERNLAPDTYHLRVRTAIYDNNAHEFAGFSDWSEPITFTIAPWTEPVTLFPLTYGFETPTYFDDGLTLGGALDRLKIYSYYNDHDQLPAHAGGESQRLLGFASAYDDEAYLVLPPLRPSTSDALVSFWWYHDNTEANQNIGVTIEQSNNGTSWSQWGSLIPRYAETSGWVKYQQVVPAGGTDPIYIRLHFVGANLTQWWKRCYLDDLTVTTFKSEQPYISYVGCNAYTATITLYDYAYQNGWPSSAFHVQYRKVGQDTWIDYGDFVNQAPYAFENSLTINGLDPNSYYEFSACARVSYNGHDFAWSNYCEPYRQWTSNDVFTVTPTHPYEHDFEFGAYNWTEGSWNTQYEGGYDGSSYCAHATADNSSVLISPVIAFSSDCNNAIIRFYKKEAVSVRVYYGPDFESSVVLSTYSSGSSWVQIELSLSKYMSQAPIKIAFENVNSNGAAESYVDDIEIIANAYDKVCDGNPGASWSNANIWYPQGVPTANDNVAVMSMVYVGSAGASPCEATAKEIWTGNSGYVYVYSQSSLVAEKLHPKNTASFTFYDGAQLKAENPSSGRFIKTIVGYTNQNGNDHYYLFAPPFSWSNNSSFTSGDYDLYHFDGSAELEWINHKNPVNNAMQRGKGYLYAHAKPSNGDTHSIVMNGELLPVSPDQTISGLTYGPNTETNPFLNWNLVGNPFPCNAYLSGNRQFYRLEETAEGSRIVLATDNVIKPMEGVFVQAATAEESSVTFTTAPTRESGMNFTLSKKSQTRGAKSVMADRVRIAIGEGRDLGHLDLMADANRLYIPLNGKDMAVMHSQPVGELPLNFEAAEDGTYTLSFENATEGLVYCHLIDNMTGADIDLLALRQAQGPAEYTFTAKKTDYASRFKVVLASVSEDANGNNETFAFNNNGNWIILNEGRATLQVIDLNGRILSSELIEGSVQTSIHQPAGLYLIRLVNGDEVKVQKVVVR